MSNMHRAILKILTCMIIISENLRACSCKFYIFCNDLENEKYHTKGNNQNLNIEDSNKSLLTRFTVIVSPFFAKIQRRSKSSL